MKSFTEDSNKLYTSFISAPKQQNLLRNFYAKYQKVPLLSFHYVDKIMFPTAITLDNGHFQY